MSPPSRQSSWRAISANYSSASFRNLSFRRCHHTSPPATQTFGINQEMHELGFSLLTPVSSQIKTPLQPLKCYWSDTVERKNRTCVSLPNAPGVPAHPAREENNENVAHGGWWWLDFLYQMEILVFLKSPLMQPVTHFLSCWILLSLCRLLCACPSILVEISKKLCEEVIISSSQSFRQNEDTIRFHLNK